MPRRLIFTWQAGAIGRHGRWLKKYRGRRYYFSGGRGKTDIEAYDTAVTAWEKARRRIDAEAPKPHQAAYERAIAEWELVLGWCHKHREEGMANEALEKLELLRKGLSATKPLTVLPEYTFEGRFDRSVRYPGLDEAVAKIGETAQREADPGSPFAGMLGYDDLQAAVNRLVNGNSGSPGSGRTVVMPSRAALDMPDTLTLEREVWRDRLDVMQRSAESPDKTTKALVDAFVAQKRADVAANGLTLGHVATITAHLGNFNDWLGSATPVEEITGQTLLDYRAHLLKDVETGSRSRTTAKQRMSTIKSFIRWLWLTENIPTLPRVMDRYSTALAIGESHTDVLVFTKSEIQLLLAKSSNRTKLYILLMLNCGMTQKDVSDLDANEVDWRLGRITRKRSKTRQHATVPVVVYQLWPETLALLKQERDATGQGRVLRNQDGGALLHDKIDPNEKYNKNDNVRCAFQRVCRKLGIKKPLKSFKKTSASLIRGHREFQGLEDLFLGHAPQKVSDKHYTKPPTELLWDATNWLRSEYGIADCFSTVESLYPDTKRKPQHAKGKKTATRVARAKRLPR